MLTKKPDITLSRLYLAESKSLRRLWIYDLTFATLTLLIFKEKSVLIKNLLLVFVPVLLQM